MYPYAAHFAKLGMVGASLEYRLLKPKSGVTPADCARDGRAAVCYLKARAADLGIDPGKIVVGGASAGGHVAAGTALFDGVDAAADDPKVSPVPAALVLFYPVIDTSPAGYGTAKCGPRWEEISPRHRVGVGVPPVLVFHGTGDTVTPFAGAELFRRAVVRGGGRCDLVAHDGGRHGYFLYDTELFAGVLKRTGEFLADAGLLPAAGR